MFNCYHRFDPSFASNGHGSNSSGYGGNFSGNGNNNYGGRVLIMVILGVIVVLTVISVYL